MKNLDKKLKIVQIKHYKQMQRESKVRTAKYKAESEKLEKDTHYYPVIALIIATIPAAAVIAVRLITVFLTKL
jgi:hypothetical protein